MSPPRYKRLRATIVELILGTDMSQHFATVNRAKARLDFINAHNMEQLNAAAEEVRLRVASA